MLTLLALYISLPWLAPAWPKPAGMARRCHLHAIQPLLPSIRLSLRIRFRGEQPFYPRGAADSAYAPFERIRGAIRSLPGAVSPLVGGLRGQRLVAARQRRRACSNSAWRSRSPRGTLSATRPFGYKTGLCARDLAIYTMIFVGGLSYRRYRWRIRPLPFWIFVIAGLGPVGIDGLSQLLSYPPFEFWPVRETTPIFRIVTGGVFGLMSAWLGFPYFERSMQDLIETLERRPAKTAEPGGGYLAYSSSSCGLLNRESLRFISPASFLRALGWRGSGSSSTTMNLLLRGGAGLGRIRRRRFAVDQALQTVARLVQLVGHGAYNGLIADPRSQAGAVNWNARSPL